MHSSLPAAVVILALALPERPGQGVPASFQHEPAACRIRAPHYVGAVGVSAWDATHRRTGVKVWIDPAMASIVDQGGSSLRSRIAYRLSRWDVPHVPRVSAVVASRADADISLTYGMTPPQPRLDGTTSRRLVDGSFTTGAEIQLNTLEALGYSTDGVLDPALLDGVATAALHEFGHALGINGHSPSRKDLMFSDGSGEACGAACGPSKADKNTLAYLACRAIENGSGWATN